MIKIDSLDVKLLRLLQENAHRSSADLAKQLDISSTTIRRRVRRLIKTGVVRILARVDPTKLGAIVPVVMAFNVSHDKINSVLETLAKINEVTWFATCTGRYDIMAILWFESNETFVSFMHAELPKIKDVKNTETFVCIKTNIVDYVPKISSAI